MAAFVELIEGMSYTLGERTFKKGAPQILADSDEIKMYRHKPNFKVTDIMATRVAVPPNKVVPPKKAVKPESESAKANVESEPAESKSVSEAQPKKVPPKKPMKRKKG